MGKGAREACRVVVGVGGRGEEGRRTPCLPSSEEVPWKWEWLLTSKACFLLCQLYPYPLFLFFSPHFSSLQDAFPASSQACSTLPSYFPLGSYNPLYLPFFFFFITISFPVTL